MRYLWMFLVTPPLREGHYIPSETQDGKKFSELVSAWPPLVTMEGTLGQAFAVYLPLPSLVSSHCHPGWLCSCLKPRYPRCSGLSQGCNCSH